MQRIPVVLQKLKELSEKGEKNTAIEIDLMLDYTRVLYADLLEWRKKAVVKIPVLQEPTLAEMAEALAKHEEPIIKEPVKPVFVEKSQPGKKDIRNNIGINDKYLFISELFRNNKDLYESVLDEINKCDNEIQALNWLQTQNDWEDENETVQSFYDTISIFFSAR